MLEITYKISTLEDAIKHGEFGKLFEQYNEIAVAVYV